MSVPASKVDRERGTHVPSEPAVGARKPMIGTHVPFSRASIKYTAAAIRESGSQAAAFFIKPKTSYVVKPLSEVQVSEFWREIGPLVRRDMILVHTSYALNLASDKAESRTKSIEGLKCELALADQLGGLKLVLHPGSNEDAQLGIRRISAGINTALGDGTGKSQVLLELMPGGAIGATKGRGLSTKIGKRFEEIAAIIAGVVHKDKIGVCWDTCHMYLSGYDLKTPDGFAEVVREFDRIVGLKYLAGVHLNDSKLLAPSAADEHAPIGAGYLGVDCFKYMMKHPAFVNIPLITETHLTPMSKARAEIELLRSFA